MVAHCRLGFNLLKTKHLNSSVNFVTEAEQMVHKRVLGQLIWSYQARRENGGDNEWSLQCLLSYQGGKRSKEIFHLLQTLCLAYISLYLSFSDLFQLLFFSPLCNVHEGRSGGGFCHGHLCCGRGRMAGRLLEPLPASSLRAPWQTRTRLPGLKPPGCCNQRPP